MAKEKKNTKKKNDDFLAQNANENAESNFQYTLDIPEDEIWSYQIEGLQKPFIGQSYKNATGKKILVVIILVVSILLSIYFSIQAVQNDVYKYNELEDGTYELVKFTNNGDSKTGIKEVVIDYVVDDNGKKDETKPITKIHEYAFNCDEILTSITFGKDVKEIDGKSIYSCWNVENVFIDDENTAYCDIDGVVYNKDVTEIIHYPNNHDKALRKEFGYDNLHDDKGNKIEELWGPTRRYSELYFRQYNRDTRTYVIPSTVTKIGELAFAYANLKDIYIPEGVETMDNMALFKIEQLNNIFSYKTDTTITDTTYKGIDQMTEVYSSLPEGLKFIGSDCCYYLRGLSYMYIPSSVETIKHHAFWDACYKDDNKNIVGVNAMNYGASEDNFNEKVTTGDQWLPQYDYLLFKKSIDVNYDATRTNQIADNVHSNYYWYCSWLFNNVPMYHGVEEDATLSKEFTEDTETDAEREEREAKEAEQQKIIDAQQKLIRENSSYLIKDFDGDKIPEMVVREYNVEQEKAIDTVYTIKHNCLTVYEGESNYSDNDLIKLAKTNDNGDLEYDSSAIDAIKDMTF